MSSRPTFDSTHVREKIFVADMASHLEYQVNRWLEEGRRIIFLGQARLDDGRWYQTIIYRVDA